MIAYGHHTLATLSNTRTDEQAGACTPPKPGCDADPRKSTPLHRGTAGAKNVRDLFLKYPNVVAYVAGHTHDNRVDLFRKGRSGFWQINTASHVDWPQQSRLIEVMDNRDGTLSLFTTLLDHAAPIARARPGHGRGGAHRTTSSAASAACWPGTTRSAPSPTRSAASRTATWSWCCATRASSGYTGWTCCSRPCSRPRRGQPPVPLALPDYSATASGAFGGSAVGGEFEATASIARRNGSGAHPVHADHRCGSSETVGATGLADNGEAIAVTVRRHRPTRRIRATIVAPDGTRSPAHTISDGSHSAIRPQVAVGADGTAVAACAWHDPEGWRVQAAVRRPGQPRFDPPQNVSPPISRLSRWLWIDVAAGTGGHVALTWYYGGAEGLAVRALRLHSAGPDGRFTAGQSLPATGGWYDVALAVGPQARSSWPTAPGASACASHARSCARRPARPAALSRRPWCSRAAAWTELGALGRGGLLGRGRPDRGVAEPGRRQRGGGRSRSSSTRDADPERGRERTVAGGRPRPLRRARAGRTRQPTRCTSAIRPQAGGRFGPDTKLADGSSPAVAMTPAGEAIALWRDGVAFHPPG